MIVTVAGVMENIDDDMMEAARALGFKKEAFYEGDFPDESSGNHRRRYPGIYRNLTAYTTPQLLGGNSNMVLATLIYQRAMSVSDWTGASVIALIMIVVTLAVIRGFNALAASWTGEVRIMRKNKILTIWAAIVFAFLMIPLLIITVTAFGGGSAITFPIESFSTLNGSPTYSRFKVFPQIIPNEPGNCISGDIYLSSGRNSQRLMRWRDPV